MTDHSRELAAREAIRDIVHRYCRGVDRLDPESMRSAYWPDAIDDHGVFVGNAWEFVEHCMVSHLKWRATMHCVMNHAIEVDEGGDTARGEVYNVTYLFGHDGSTIDTWYGRYLDRYECREGEWRIAHRVCVHEGTRSETITPMAMATERFRQGDADRPNGSVPLGPGV
jgi:hypothetical protein